MSFRYPETRRVDATDELAGLTFADPYRWLEGDTPEVRAWQREQNELAAAYVRDWPYFDDVRRLVERFNAPRHPSLPSYAAGRWFHARASERTGEAQVLVSDEPYGPGRLLFSAPPRDPGAPVFISWTAPAPDGGVLAIGVCDDGSEQNTIRLVDVATGRELPDPPSQVLMDAWTGGVNWLADSTGFFFSAIDGAAVDFAQQVYLHRRDGAPSTVRVDVPWVDTTEYRTVTVSADGRHAVAAERLMKTVPVAVARLDGPRDLCWRPFVTAYDGVLAGHVVGDDYIAVATDEDSPRGRVVAIRLDSPDPNDRSSWRELVPASDAVVRGVVPVGERLLLNELVDTYARIRVVSTEGEYVGDGALPGRGAIHQGSFPIMTVGRRPHPEKYLFNFSSPTTSWSVYQYDPSTGRLHLLQRPTAAIEDAVVEERIAVGADGVEIPYHVVHRRDLRRDVPQPTLIHAYGGFNVAWVPKFSGVMAAFVEAGGIVVHAHLRGGGELGLRWWHDGRLANKQNCYADLYAVAEDLIGTGVTTPARLAVTGGSNGGWLCGMAVTGRPDLWTAVAARFPLLDLIGGCRDAYDLMCISAEFADPSDADEVRRLAGISPYHLVEGGAPYPAIFLDGGDTDPRCPPWHARKFAARLQAATGSDAPVLVRIWENAGHGRATGEQTVLRQDTEFLAFIMRRLELAPERPRPRTA